jgi:hypothetical protein
MPSNEGKIILKVNICIVINALCHLERDDAKPNRTLLVVNE